MKSIKNVLTGKVVEWAKVISLGLILGLGIQVTYSWVAPTQAPPGGNLDAPITVGAAAQTKTGKLRTASTVAGDPGTTLVTKDYVSALAATTTQFTRGAHYGFCGFQTDANFVRIGPLPVFNWPATSCSTAGTGCAAGFTGRWLQPVQMNTAAGGASFNTFLDADTYWFVGVCVKN